MILKNKVIAINKIKARIKIASSKKTNRYRRIESKINTIYARLSDILVKLISITNFSPLVKTRLDLSLEVSMRILF